MQTFDLAYYPSERGSYNYDVTGNEGFSAGINEDGTLKNPETRWGGIMRRFDYTDFESNNYEYIEFLDDGSIHRKSKPYRWINGF